jgi:hypothetical protein
MALFGSGSYMGFSGSTAYSDPWKTGLTPEGSWDPNLTADQKAWAGSGYFFTEPLMAREMLNKMAEPGGYLSNEQTSLEAAGSVRSLAQSGAQAYRSLLDTAGASGLNPMYARARAGSVMDQTRQAIGGTMVDARAEAIRRRAEAEQSWTNLAMSTSMQAKLLRQQDKQNRYMAKKGGKAGMFGGLMELGGGIIYSPQYSNVTPAYNPYQQ